MGGKGRCYVPQNYSLLYEHRMANDDNVLVLVSEEEKQCKPANVCLSIAV